MAGWFGYTHWFARTYRVVQITAKRLFGFCGCCGLVAQLMGGFGRGHGGL